MTNIPGRHFRLTCWRLLYHVPVEKLLDRQDEIDACLHSRLDVARWDAGKTQWPLEWAKVLAKRQRRLEWFQQHGSVPPGWCPPDPADPRRTANKPLGAYMARRHYSLEGFLAAESGCGANGRPSEHVADRITRWLER